MISFDAMAKGVSGATRTSKLSKKEESKKTKFITNGKAQQTVAGEGSKEIANIAPMLFMQEINEYDVERGNLQEFSEKAFYCLRDLQLALMRDELKEHHLYNIKNTLKSNTSKFNIPELADIFEDITRLMEVQIAKIEVNKKSNFNH